MSSTPQNPKSTPSSHWPDTSSSNQHPTTHPSSMDFTSQPHFSITHQRPIEKFSNVACGKCYLSHGKLKRKGQHWVTIKEDNRSNLIWIMWSKKILRPNARCTVGYCGALCDHYGWELPRSLTLVHIYFHTRSPHAISGYTHDGLVFFLDPGVAQLLKALMSRWMGGWWSKWGQNLIWVFLF